MTNDHISWNKERDDTARYVKVKFGPMYVDAWLQCTEENDCWFQIDPDGPFRKISLSQISKLPENISNDKVSNMKTITTEDVHFDLSIEPEFEVIEGNLICSGDDEYDKKCYDETYARMERGDHTAWCILVVQAKWTHHGNVFEECNSLGGYSFPEDCSNHMEYAKDDFDSLKQECVEGINRRIKDYIAKAKDLEQELTN